MNKFKCGVPGCTGETTRVPHVCTKHFLEGWGRLPGMSLPKPPESKPEGPKPQPVEFKPQNRGK